MKCEVLSECNLNLQKLTLRLNSYNAFFDKPHSGCLTIDKKRFLSREGKSHPGPENLSLKSIVMAHGASISPQYMHLHRKFYEASRKHFEQAEMGEGFVSIAALQACILLAWYELKHALFTRAWSSVSRAIWMAEVFGLRTLDQSFVSPRRQKSQNQLMPTTNLLDLEERRRTFWAAFNLTCYASISTCWSTDMPINYVAASFLMPFLIRIC